MPLHEREKIAGIVHMRVVNPKAPRTGEIGTVVDILSEMDDQQEMTVFQLQFEAGEKPIAYDVTELEIVMP